MYEVRVDKNYIQINNYFSFKIEGKNATEIEKVYDKVNIPYKVNGKN